MDTQRLRLGQVVSSRAGRDSGIKYVVIGIIDDKHVLVANGHNRPVSKPKKKNVRHLLIHNVVDQSLEAQLSTKARIDDKSILRVIEETDSFGNLERQGGET